MRGRFAPGLACFVLCVAICGDRAFAADPDPQHQGHVPQASPQVTARTSLGLADLEQMALQRNPTLAQAAAQVEASQARALQAGLYPNPVISYDAEQMGAVGQTRGAALGERPVANITASHSMVPLLVATDSPRAPRAMDVT